MSDDYFDRLAALGVRQCAAGHGHEVKTIGLGLVQGETREERYVRWCRDGGRNPWCGVVGCPEQSDSSKFYGG